MRVSRTLFDNWVFSGPLRRGSLVLGLGHFRLRRQGEGGQHSLMSRWQGSHSEIWASLMGVLWATHLDLVGLREAWPVLGQWWQAWCPQELVRGTLLSPASLVPCPMPGDRHRDSSDKALDSGVKPRNSLLSWHSVNFPGVCHVPISCEKANKGTQLTPKNAALNMALFLERKVEKNLGEHYHPAASVSTFIRLVKRRNRADRYHPWNVHSALPHTVSSHLTKKIDTQVQQVQQFHFTDAESRFWEIPIQPKCIECPPHANPQTAVPTAARLKICQCWSKSPCMRKGFYPSNKFEKYYKLYLPFEELQSFLHYQRLWEVLQ